MKMFTLWLKDVTALVCSFNKVHFSFWKVHINNTIWIIDLFLTQIKIRKKTEIKNMEW
jgi:hypothetical protein